MKYCQSTDQIFPEAVQPGILYLLPQLEHHEGHDAQEGGHLEAVSADENIINVRKVGDKPHDVIIFHLRVRFETVHEAVVEVRPGVDGEGHGEQVDQEDEHLLVEHSLVLRKMCKMMMNILDKPWQMFSTFPPRAWQ